MSNSSPFSFRWVEFTGVFGGGVYISAFDYDNAEDGSIYRQVDRHYRNLGYNQNISIVANDIMVIRLAEPVRNVSPVSLNQDSEEPTDFEKLMTLGFGFTSFDGDIPTQLMQVEMNYIPPETCFDDLEVFDNVQPGPGILWYVFLIAWPFRFLSLHVSNALSIK